MQKWIVSALIALAGAVPMAQAGDRELALEPALVMHWNFGGSTQADPLGLALRLNYPSQLRHSLAGFGSSGLDPATQLSGRSLMFKGPALAQFDFSSRGFEKAAIAGAPLVARMVRNQTEGAVPAEESSWLDWGNWGWRGWGMVGVGALGLYLLSDNDESSSAPSGAAGGGGSGGGGTENPPEEECVIPDPILGGCIL